MSLKMKYFVLKPASKNPNDIYASASRIAMHAYANHISRKNPELAQDLKEWAHKELEKTR
jgi:hypothetical protein